MTHHTLLRDQLALRAAVEDATPTARAVHIGLARRNLDAARRWSPPAVVRRCGHYGDAQRIQSHYLADAAHHRRQAADA